MTVPGKLDVHAHYLPDAYRQALERAGHSQPDGMPEIPTWSAAEHVALDGPPGDRHLAPVDLDTWRPPRTAGRGRRPGSPGERGRPARRRRPSRSLRPARFAPAARCRRAPWPRSRTASSTSTSTASSCSTNVDGTYLGDPAWDPVFDELDRRAARVLIHPTRPVCWEHTSFGRPRPMLEFLFDTTRAVVNLVLNGTVARHPNIRLVIPHAGATLPVIADRVAAFVPLLGVDPSIDVLRDLGEPPLRSGRHADPTPARTRCWPSPRSTTSTTAATSRSPPTSSPPWPPNASTQAGEPPGSLAEALRANTQRLFPGSPPSG